MIRKAIVSGILFTGAAFAKETLIRVDCSAPLTKTVGYRVTVNVDDDATKQPKNTMLVQVVAERQDREGYKLTVLETYTLPIVSFQNSEESISAKAEKDNDVAGGPKTTYDFTVKVLPDASEDGYHGKLKSEKQTLSSQLRCTAITQDK